MTEAATAAVLTIEDLARNPSPESWRLLCDALAKLPEKDALALIDKIEPSLDQWDDKLRATMCGMDWDDRFFAGNPDPRSKIVRFFRFDRIFFGRYDGSIRMRSPSLGEAQMTRLASSRGVKFLKRIDFSGHPLGTDGVRALGRGKHFDSLVELVLGNCDLSASSMQAISGASFFSRLHEIDVRGNSLRGSIAPLVTSEASALRELGLDGNPLGEEGALAVANARAPNLVVLDLSSCELGVAGARALSKHAALPILESLNVSSNELRDEGLAALASGSLRARVLLLNQDAITAKGIEALFGGAVGGWPIVRLSLRSNAIGDDAVEKIVSLAPDTLAELNLDDNDVTGSGLGKLLGSDHFPLRSLCVSGNRVGAEAMHHIGRSIRTVQSLELADNRVEDEGARHLAGAHADELRTLSLARNGITARGVETLSGAPWFGSLTTLDLSNNPLGVAGGLVLGARFLTSLSLRSCALGDEGARMLAAAEFRPNRLDLSDCDLTDSGLEALAESGVLANVETLLLNQNRITNRGVFALIRSKSTSNIRVLHVEGNRIDDAGAIAMAEWNGPLAFHTDDNAIGTKGDEALGALPARCCP